MLYFDHDFGLPESMPEVVSFGNILFELNPNGKDAPSLFIELNVVYAADLLPLRIDYLSTDDLGTKQLIRSPGKKSLKERKCLSQLCMALAGEITTLPRSVVVRWSCSQSEIGAI